MLLFFHSLVPVLVLAAPSLAISIPFAVRYSSSSSVNNSSSFNSSSSANSSSNSSSPSNSSSSVVSVGNTQNAYYYANVTLGGRQISVMLDTGSSDLWVTGSVPDASDTGNSLTLSYAVGSAAGNVYTAPFRFSNYTVQDQAFLLVLNTSSFSTDIHSEGYDGLIGLGPNSGSSIYHKLSGDSGNSPMNRIFQQSSSGNYITLMLSRQGDPASQMAGQFTISSIVPGFESISNQPQLNVEKVNRLTDRDQHWQILTDKDVGMIGPDGQPIQYTSIAPKAPQGQVVAVLDSGFTLSQVPRTVSDAIYGRVQGAEWSPSNQAWLVPCEQLINVTFNFGGTSYPVHPLDVSSSDFGVTFANGNTACLGTFQPISSAFSLLGEYDMILGMAFLRSTYSLFNYGNLVKGGSSPNNPYVQLLSLTNETAAVQDFIQVRLNGQNLIDAPQFALLPVSQQQFSPESQAEHKAMNEEILLSRWPWLGLGFFVLFVFLITYCVWRCCCCCSCGSKRLARKKPAKQQLDASDEVGPYAQLQDSRSSSSLVMKPIGSTYEFKGGYGEDAFARH